MYVKKGVLYQNFRQILFKKYILIGQMDYKVDVRGKVKTLHAYLLKKYIERDDGMCCVFDRL